MAGRLRSLDSILIRCTHSLDGRKYCLFIFVFFCPLQYSMSLDTYFKAALIKYQEKWGEGMVGAGGLGMRATVVVAMAMVVVVASTGVKNKQQNTYDI